MRALSILFMFMVSAGLTAADWPQYLGPSRTGVSNETGLARTWPAGGPKVLWTAEVGPGYNSPAIAQGKAYFLIRDDEAQEKLRCLDLASGAEQWTFQWPAPGKPFSHPGGRSTPTIENDRAYIIGSLGDMLCLDLTKRELLWKKHLVKDFGGEVPRWGVTQSPLLLRDWVILAPQAPEAGVVACDKITGKEIWRAKLANEHEYASPMLATIDGVEQVIMANGQANVVPPALAAVTAARGHKFEPGKGTVITGIDSLTGQVLWTYTAWQCRYPMPPPIAIGDGRIFITGGYGAGCAMIRPAKDEKGWAVREVWRGDQCQSKLHAPILHQGHLYANSDDNKSGLTCLDLDGAVKWQTGKDLNLDMGSLILADGMIFALAGGTGELHLAEATPAGYRPLAKAKVLEPPQVWGLLALADGKLIVRDQKQAKCLDVSGAKGQ